MPDPDLLFATWPAWWAWVARMATTLGLVMVLVMVVTDWKERR